MAEFVFRLVRYFNTGPLMDRLGPLIHDVRISKNLTLYIRYYENDFDLKVSIDI